MSCPSGLPHPTGRCPRRRTGPPRPLRRSRAPPVGSVGHRGQLSGRPGLPAGVATAPLLPFTLVPAEPTRVPRLSHGLWVSPLLLLALPEGARAAGWPCLCPCRQHPQAARAAGPAPLGSPAPPSGAPPSLTLPRPLRQLGPRGVGGHSADSLSPGLGSASGPSILTVTPDPMGWIQDKSPPNPARRVVRVAAPPLPAACQGVQGGKAGPRSPSTRSWGPHGCRGAPDPAPCLAKRRGERVLSSPPSPPASSGRVLGGPAAPASKEEKAALGAAGSTDLCPQLPRSPACSRRAAGRFVGTRELELEMGRQAGSPQGTPASCQQGPPPPRAERVGPGSSHLHTRVRCPAPLKGQLFSAQATRRPSPLVRASTAWARGPALVSCS